LSEKPSSVKIIAVVTLIATLLVTLVLGWTEVLLLSKNPSEFTMLVDYTLVALILQGYAFIISIAMLVSDSMYVWYGSVAFWISIIVADLSFTLPFFSFVSPPPSGFLVLFFSPMLSSIICLYFFLRGKVKDYFHV
jgi:hypothetical protein